MFFAYLFPSLVLAYLAGSLNFAIIVTWIVRRQDIRTLGNKKPGTANVGRNVGKGWAAIVFFADVAKGLMPIVLAGRLLFPTGSWADTFALILVGMAAILGHTKPVFFGFRGGGGIATSIGVFAFFVPFELLISLLLSFGTVMIFFRDVEFPLGQWVSFLFVSITPVVAVALNFVDLPVVGEVGIGGHGWYVLVGVLILTLFVHSLNIKLILRRMGELKKGSES